jgi:predicted transcriptional regulator
MTNDRLFSLRLPSEMLDQIERIAEEDDRTIADVVRRALRQYLDARDV